MPCDTNQYPSFFHVYEINIELSCACLRYCIIIIKSECKHDVLGHHCRPWVILRPIKKLFRQDDDYKVFWQNPLVFWTETYYSNSKTLTLIIECSPVIFMFVRCAAIWAKVTASLRATQIPTVRSTCSAATVATLHFDVTIECHVTCWHVLHVQYCATASRYLTHCNGVIVDVVGARSNNWTEFD